MSTDELSLSGDLYTRDCLEYMREQDDDTFDLVFGSPPYESARSYGVGFSLSGQDWVDWMVECVTEASRICRGLVAVVVAGRTRNFRWSATPALLMADLHRAGISLRRPVIFHRVGIPGSGGPDWLRSDTEFVVCCSKGRLPWSDNTAMGQPPKYQPGGALSHWKTSTSGYSGGDIRVKRVNYTPPEKANPGNVIWSYPTQNELLRGIITYGYATQTRPREVLQALRKAIEEKALFEWSSGIIAGLRSSSLLRPDLHGGWTEDSAGYYLRSLWKGVPSEERKDTILLHDMRGTCSEEMPRECDSVRDGKAFGEGDYCQNEMRGVRSDIRSCCSPQGRESNKQRESQLDGSLPCVPRKSSQSQDAAIAALCDLWKATGEELQECRNLVRQALPAIQNVWLSAIKKEEVWKQMGTGGVSNMITCSVGGGKMGHSLAHENEAPFPSMLAEFFIRSFCPPDGLVLDPWCGSGTTCAVAAQCGRRFVGVDIRESQIELTYRRLCSKEPEALAIS